MERNVNAENVRNEASEIRSFPSSDHSNLSDAEHSTYMFTEDEIVLTYTLGIASEFNPFIMLRNHPLHRCRPLSKVWVRFLMASPAKDSVILSAFVKEDVEEYAYFRAIVRDKQDQIITFKSIKNGQFIFVDKAELTLATTVAASYCVTGIDLEDEERENRNCEVEDDHPKGG